MFRLTSIIISYPLTIATPARFERALILALGHQRVQID
jgi:hypothetical protein